MIEKKKLLKSVITKNKYKTLMNKKNYSFFNWLIDKKK